VYLQLCYPLGEFLDRAHQGRDEFQIIEKVFRRFVRFIYGGILIAAEFHGKRGGGSAYLLRNEPLVAALRL
jgi:hypothetical protein